jgi:ketosteroid isomerase-like protein
MSMLFRSAALQGGPGLPLQHPTDGRIIAVSQQKFEAVRKVVLALNERDADGYLACCTDDVELVPATAAIAGTFIGLSGIQRFFADLRDAAPGIHS